MVETGGYGLDVLVNAAGILVLGPVEAVSGQQTRAQRPARPAAASFAAAGRGVAVKYEGWGFNATDKLMPEQRRQQDYRALGERAERISGGD
jgi:hypothetical protein